MQKSKIKMKMQNSKRIKFKKLSNRCYRSQKSIKETKLAAKFLKNIGEENRLRLLCLLREGAKCVCEIWRYLNLSQNLVSHHLKVLKDFDLVSSKREGLKISYKLNKKVVKKYLKLLSKFLKEEKI